MASKFDSSSKFNIYSSFTLSNDDVNVVSLLYAPLMGSDALMLYLGLYSLIERNNLKSESIKHEDFFDIFSFTSVSFLKARIKLEGIGLLISYEMQDKSYTYVICPPLTAKSFIKDATLGLYLYAKITKDTFDFIYNHFKVEKIDKANAINITKTFDDVYQSQIDNEITYDKFKYILGKRTNRNLKIKNYNFDFDFFVKGINLDFLETGIKEIKQENTYLKNKIDNMEKDMKELLNFKKEIEKKEIENEKKRIKIDSNIIKNNNDYKKYLKNWINPNQIVKTELLMRLSRDGDSVQTFHNLCDNISPTLVLA